MPPAAAAVGRGGGDWHAMSRGEIQLRVDELLGISSSDDKRAIGPLPLEGGHPPDMVRMTMGDKNHRRDQVLGFEGLDNILRLQAGIEDEALG